MVKTFWESITRPGVYAQIIGQRLKRSLAYFLGFYLLLSILASAWITLMLVPELVQRSFESLELAREAYPTDAVVRIEEGQMSLSGSQSEIRLPLPEQAGLNAKHLLVVDPNASGRDLERKETLVLLTPQTLALASAPDLSSVRIFSWEELGTSGSWDYLRVYEMIDRAETWIELLKGYIFPLLTLGIGLGLIIYRLIYVLLYGLILSLAGSLMQRPYGYQRFLNLGFHTIVLAELVALGQFILFGFIHPTVFSLTYMGVSLIAILTLPTVIRITKTRI